MDRSYNTNTTYPTIADCMHALRFGVTLKGVRHRVCDELDRLHSLIGELRTAKKGCGTRYDDLEANTVFVCGENQRRCFDCRLGERAAIARLLSEVPA